jgi:hypothetical protein
MAVVVFTRFTGLTPERYDELVAALHLDIDPPAGIVLRVATESPEGVVTCEVWQTAEAFNAFFQQRLRPVLLRRRVREEPTARIVPLHELFAPDLGAIERTVSASHAH